MLTKGNDEEFFHTGYRILVTWTLRDKNESFDDVTILQEKECISTKLERTLNSSALRRISDLVVRYSSCDFSIDRDIAV